jgi:hypothetical protein
MPVEALRRSSLLFRYSLGFPRTEGDYGPGTAWALLRPAVRRDERDDFVLAPVRHRRSDQADEWYLGYDRDVDVQYRVAFPGRNNSVEYVFSSFVRVAGSLRLTLGEVAPSRFLEPDWIPTFVLTGGSVASGIPAWQRADRTEVLAYLWPTRNHRDVSRLRSEPGGFFVEGRLPASFFPPGLPAEERLVTLRLPGDQEDFAEPDGRPPVSPAPVDPRLVTARPFWSLTSHPFRANGHDSVRHTNLWVRAFDGPFLPAAVGRRLSSLVDSVLSSPDERCIVGVFAVTGASRRVGWFARDVRTRVNVGGGGVVAEASFTPERLVGTAAVAGGWEVRLVAPPVQSSPPNGDGATPPSLSFVLDRRGGRDEVTIALENAVLHPLVSPTVPIEAPRVEGGIALTDRTGERLWLCTESGWAAVDAPGGTAVLDPRAVTPGALLGVLEVGPLMVGFGRASEPGITIDAQATGRGDVALVLAGRTEGGGTQVPEQLGLTLTRPFLTVTTPAVFYRPPGAVPEAGLPALTSDLAPESTDADTPEFNRFLQQLDRQVGTERFRSGVFVSQEATRPRDQGASERLEVQVLFEDRTFLLGFPSGRTSVWDRAARLPLVRSVPLRPDQDLGGFLDPNRGMLPFRTDTAEVRVAFPPGGLPRVVQPGRAAATPLLTVSAAGGAVVTANWRLTAAAAGGSAAHYLCTLPGLELDPTPQMAARPGPPVWVYRHGVPALDEAYAVAAESRRDPGAPPSPPVPAPGDFSPGFDPTRVVGAEAFRFGDTFPPQATGWVHRTEANQAGAVSLAASAPPELLGRFPRLQVALAGREVVFSRTETVAGLTAELLVTPPAEADGLPSFSVTLAPTDDRADRERIAHGGQPLLAARIRGKVLTQDGVGYRNEEPTVGSRTARSRQLGSEAATSRYSGREAILPGVVLDLVGVDLAEPLAGPSGSPLQGWMLHDGTGGVPRLAGVRLVRRRLATLQRTGAALVAGLDVVLSPVPQRADDLPAHDREPVPLPGERPLTLTVQRAFDTPNAAWSLAGVSGGFDWQFRDGAGDPGSPVVTRVVATVTGPPAADGWPVTVTRVELTGPTGPIVLDPLTAGARLDHGTLRLLRPVSYTTAGFSAIIAPFAVDTTTLIGRPVPEGPLLAEFEFNWAPDPVGGVFERRLSYKRPAGTDRGAWAVAVLRSGSPLVAAEVVGVQASADSYLFRSVDDPQVLDPLPDGSWFGRTEPDLVLAGARFPRPTVLAALPCEVRLVLRQKTGARFRRERERREDAPPTVIARWSIPGAVSEVPPAVSLSGWLEFESHLRLELPDGTAVRHFARIHFDNADWSFAALFLGQGGPSAVSFVCLAEHRFEWAERAYSFQSVQPVRLRTATEFSRLYLDGAGVGNGEAATRLVLDASWVFWLTRPAAGRAAVTSGVSSFELESDSWAEWIGFRLRPAGRGELATRPAFVARLPFGYAGTTALPRRVVRLTDRPREPLLSGAQGGVTIDPLRPAGSRTDVHPDFLRRGPNALWLDATSLAGLFAASDLRVGVNAGNRSTEFLPGYDDRSGNPTNSLPGELGDWGLVFRGAKEVAHSDGAALRTPYAPLGDVVPVRGSNLVEVPFLFGPVTKPADGDGTGEDRAVVQLIAFAGNDIQVIRRAGLERTGTVTPRDWAVGELAAARRDEAAFLLVDGEEVTVIPRPVDPTRGFRERPRWGTSPLGPDHGATDRPPPRPGDERERPPAFEDELSDRVVFDPPDVTDLDDRWSRTPQWFAFAARPQVPPPELKTRAVAATRVRLALAGGAGRLTSAAVEVVQADVADDAATQRLVRGSLVGLTKTEDVPFEVCDPATGAGRFPSPGAGPHARRDAVSRDWNVTGLTTEDDGSGRTVARVVTVAAPLIDLVSWARRPGEFTRAVMAGQRIDVVRGNRRRFRYAPAPGEAITLRRPRAEAGPYEQVSIAPVAAYTLSNNFFQYVRLDLTQTLDATKPPPQGGLVGVLATKADVRLSARDPQTAATEPAIIRKTASNRARSVEPFEFWLVADAGFIPTADFPGGTKPALRTVVVFQPDPEIPETNPADSSEPVSDTADRVVLFEKPETLLKPPRPPAPDRWDEVAPWRPVLPGVAALPAVRDGTKAQQVNDLAAARDGFYVLVLQYTKASDADDAPWVKPGAPLAVVRVAPIDSANEPVLPKCVAAVLHAPAQAAADPRAYSLCGHAQLDNDDFGPVEPQEGPEEDGTTLVAWSRVANLQTLDRVAGAETVPSSTEPAFEYDVAFYGPGGELVPIAGEAG